MTLSVLLKSIIYPSCCLVSFLKALQSIFVSFFRFHTQVIYDVYLSLQIELSKNWGDMHYQGNMCEFTYYTSRWRSDPVI